MKNKILFLTFFFLTLNFEPRLASAQTGILERIESKIDEVLKKIGGAVVTPPPVDPPPPPPPPPVDPPPPIDPPPTPSAIVVSLNGSDSNPGTVNQPFRTLAKACSSLNPGGVLFLRAGTYAAGLPSNCLPAGLADDTDYKNVASAWPAVQGKYTVVMGYPGDAPPVVLGQFAYLSGLAKSRILIKGIRINATGASKCFETQGSSDNSATAPTRIIFEDLECWGASASGANGQGDQIIYRRIWFHDVGTRILDHGCYCHPTNSLWEDNIFERATGYGLHIYGEGATNAIIRRNIARFNVEAGIWISSNTQNALVERNVVYGNKGWGGIAIGRSSKAVIVNNTLWNNSGGINISEGSANGARVEKNICFQTGICVSNSGTGTVKTGNWENGDPLFIDIKSTPPNLRLQPGSPARAFGGAYD